MLLNPTRYLYYLIHTHSLLHTHVHVTEDGSTEMVATRCDSDVLTPACGKLKLRLRHVTVATTTNTAATTADAATVFINEANKCNTAATK